MPVFYVMLGYIISRLLNYSRYGHGTSPIKNLKKSKDFLLESYKKMKAQGGNIFSTFFMSMSIAVLVEALMPKGGSIMLALMISGGVLNYKTKNSSMLMSFLQIFFRDLRRIVNKNEEDPSYQKLAINLMSVSVFLALFGLIRFFLPISDYMVLAVGIILFIIARSNDKPDAATTGMTLFLLCIAGITALLYAVPALAHDGGFQEAGGTFQGWARSQGAPGALLHGIVPGGSAALGSLLGSGASVWDVNVTDPSPFGGGPEPEFEFEPEPEDGPEPEYEPEPEPEPEPEYEPEPEPEEKPEPDKGDKEEKDEFEESLKELLKELRKAEEEARKEQERRNKYINKLAEKYGVAWTPSGERRDFTTPQGQKMLKKIMQREQALNEYDADRHKMLAKEWERQAGNYEAVKHTADFLNDILEHYGGPAGKTVNTVYKFVTNMTEEIGNGIVDRKDWKGSDIFKDAFAGAVKTGIDMGGDALLSNWKTDLGGLEGAALTDAMKKNFGKNMVIKTGQDLSKMAIDKVNMDKDPTAKDFVVSLGRNVLLSGIDTGMERVNVSVENVQTTEFEKGLPRLGKQGVDGNKVGDVAERMLDGHAIEKQSYDILKTLADDSVATVEKIIQGDFTSE